MRAISSESFSRSRIIQGILSSPIFNAALSRLSPETTSNFPLFSEDGITCKGCIIP